MAQVQKVGRRSAAGSAERRSAAPKAEPAPNEQTSSTGPDWPSVTRPAVVWPLAHLEASPAPKLLPLDELSFGNMGISIEWLLQVVGGLLTDYREYAKNSQGVSNVLVDRLRSLEDYVATAPWKVEEPEPEEEEEDQAPEEVEEKEPEILGDEFWSTLPMEATEDVLTPPASPPKSPPAPPPVPVDEAVQVEPEEPEEDPFAKLWEALQMMEQAMHDSISGLAVKLDERFAGLEDSMAAKSSRAEDEMNELQERLRKVEQTAELALEKGKMAEGIVGSLREMANKVALQEEKVQELGEVLAGQQVMHNKLKQHGTSALETLLKLDMADEVRRLRSHVEIMEQEVSQKGQNALKALREMEEARGGGVGQLDRATSAVPSETTTLSPKSTFSPKSTKSGWGGLRSAVGAMSFASNVSRAGRMSMTSRAASVVELSQQTMELANMPSVSEDDDLSPNQSDPEPASASIPMAELERLMAQQREEVKQLLKKQEASLEKTQATLYKAVRDNQRETDWLKARVSHMWEERELLQKTSSSRKSPSSRESRRLDSRQRRFSGGSPPASPQNRAAEGALLAPSTEKVVADLVEAEVQRTLSAFNTGPLSSILGDLLKEAPTGTTASTAALAATLAAASPGDEKSAAAAASTIRLDTAVTEQASTAEAKDDEGGESSPSAALRQTLAEAVAAVEQQDASGGATASGATGANTGAADATGAPPKSPLGKAMQQLVQAHDFTSSRCKELGLHQGKLTEALQKTQQGLALQISKHAAQIFALSNRLDALVLSHPAPPAGGGPHAFGRVPSPCAGHKHHLHSGSDKMVSPFAKHMLEGGRTGHEHCKRQINVKSLEASRSVGRLPHLGHTKELLKM